MKAVPTPVEEETRHHRRSDDQSVPCEFAKREEPGRNKAPEIENGRNAARHVLDQIAACLQVHMHVGKPGGKTSRTIDHLRVRWYLQLPCRPHLPYDAVLDDHGVIAQHALPVHGSTEMPTKAVGRPPWPRVVDAEDPAHAATEVVSTAARASRERISKTNRTKNRT